MSDLDVIFNDAEEVDVVETPEPANSDNDSPQEPEQEGADAIEADKVEKEEAVTTTPETTTKESDTKSVPIAALMAERAKRQEIEKQLAEVNKKPAPDVFEDPDGYTQHLTQEFNTKLLNERLNMSEMLARRDHPDLDEKYQEFESLVTANPTLRDQVMNSPSPYHELVNVVEKHRLMSEIDNIDSFKEKTRAEIEAKVRAEVMAEMESKKAQDKELREAIPTSLVDEPSKGAISKAKFEGHVPLENIFND